MAGDEYTVQVTTEELDVLRQWRAAQDDGSALNEVIGRVTEALHKPAIACLFPNWRNGVVVLRIEFENGRVKYVVVAVESCLKTGVEI